MCIALRTEVLVLGFLFLGNFCRSLAHCDGGGISSWGDVSACFGWAEAVVHQFVDDRLVIPPFSRTRKRKRADNGLETKQHIWLNFCLRGMKVSFVLGLSVIYLVVY